jgi:hypothetical protein
LKRIFAFCFLLSQSLLVACAAVSFAAAQTPGGNFEEFSGPFPSWRNLKTFYGAVGDGKADDTAALQRALDDVTLHKDFCVLYIPAGTYRLTATVKTVRKHHTDCQGIAIVGESPETTVLLWDGPASGTVFRYDAWYSKISRLAIDGARRAHIALHYGPAFSTYNETSDLTLRDADIGILFGGGDSQGQAENEVLRCRFLRCASGVATANFNSMDIWVWYSSFEDCEHALFNGAGNFHAWQNLFLRSRIADIGSQNLMVFSFVNNTSIGSGRFLDFESGHTWGSPMTISGNRILDPLDDFPLRLGNGGPYLVMDNIFKLRTGSSQQAAKMTWGDQTFVGNNYTVNNAVKENGRFRRLAEKLADPNAIDTTPPVMPPTPSRGERKMIEVPAGAGAVAIQEALDEAAALRGQRPVVHLPMGIYNVTKTLIVPAESDVQLVGDSAGETGTRLNWTGPAGGMMLKLEGPAVATLRDLYLHAPGASAILVENADQPGGRIFADQLNVSGPSGKSAASTSALRVNGLAETDVQFRCLQGNGNSGNWVEVVGGHPVHNPVSIFNGATGSATGQYNVHDGGQLVVRGVYHERSEDTLRGIYLADSGALAIDATRFSYQTSLQAPLVAVENFKGLFTLTTSQLQPVGSTNTCRFELAGDGTAADVLALNDMFWVLEPGVTSEKVWLNNAKPPAHGGLIGCNMNSNVKGLMKDGFGFLENIDDPAEASAVSGSRGTVSDAALLRHLAPLREARVWLPGEVPAHTTNLRIYRVMATGSRGAVVEFRAGQ